MGSLAGWRMRAVLGAVLLVGSLSGAFLASRGTAGATTVRPQLLTPQRNLGSGSVTVAPFPSGPSPIPGEGPDPDQKVPHSNVPGITDSTNDTSGSGNWSGRIDRGTTFTAVVGYWIVPSVAPSTSPKYVAAWIGIGGTTGTGDHLIQTGTTSDTSDGTTSYHPWVEVLPSASVTIDEPVSPGDEMGAEIEEVSTNHWDVIVQDVTKDWGIEYKTITYTAGPASSAEWITERPTVDGSLSTLADFTSVRFHDIKRAGADLAAVTATTVEMLNTTDSQVIAYAGSLRTTTTGDFTDYYVAPPTVTSVSPSQGSTNGGTSVTINGTYLITGLVQSVYFGADAASFDVSSPDLVTATAPVESAGTVNVTVTTTDGTSAMTSASQFTYTTPTNFNWRKLTPATSPPPDETASIAYDPATGQLILFGGMVTYHLVSTTWDWNGTTWTKLSPATIPHARTSPYMAYDTATGQLILFGGAYTTSSTKSRVDLSTTWDWNGTTWTEVSSTGPTTAHSAASSPFDFSSMAYDKATRQLILFGGYSQTYGDLRTTWEWNGTTWALLSPTTSPTYRSSPAIAYDTASGQLILFGGFTGTDGHPVTTWSLSTTWEWNGTTWTELSPAKSPHGRQNASIAYDPTLGQLVLFGGSYTVSGSFDGIFLSTTWEWNGSTWTELATANSPAARRDASMAYDTATGQLILFGGVTHTDTTWVLTDVTPPFVSSVNPKTGPTSGGTSVTITGTNLTGALVVDFGSTPAASFRATNSTTIAATSPAGTGTANVTVTTPSGTSAVTSADLFTFVAPPPPSSGGGGGGGGGGGTPTPSSPTPPPAPTHTSSHKTCSVTSGTCSASNDGVAVTASGPGALTVSQYSSNPDGVTSFTSTGEYFDVEVASTSAFTSVAVKDCNLNGGSILYWWNVTTSTWETVSPVSGPSGSPPCLTATLSTTSTPTISQLKGTVFAIGLGTTQRIYGATADATAATELEHQFPYTTGTCPGTTGTRPVVLATDATYPDALSSAYLARYLGTGTLLTPTESLSAPTLTAIHKEGITTV